MAIFAGFPLPWMVWQMIYSDVPDYVRSVYAIINFPYDLYVVFILNLCIMKLCMGE